MRPELGRAHPTIWTGRPPHMAAADLPLWREWIHSHHHHFDALFFDAALGTAPDPGPEQPENYRYAWIRLNRYRADVIAVSPTGWTIIEVRPRAGASAIGALLTYRQAWFLDPPDDRPVTLILVTDQVRPEIAALARQSGILVQLVRATPDAP